MFSGSAMGQSGCVKREMRLYSVPGCRLDCVAELHQLVRLGKQV